MRTGNAQLKTLITEINLEFESEPELLDQIMLIAKRKAMSPQEAAKMLIAKQLQNWYGFGDNIDRAKLQKVRQALACPECGTKTKFCLENS